MASFESENDPITDPAREPSVSDLTGLLPSSVPEPPEIEVRPGRIQKLDVLSDGLHDTVYKASTEDGMDVFAVRTLSGLERLGVADAVVAEITEWERIGEHSHVHTLLEWGSTPTVWLALEFVEGRTLRDRIDDLDGGGALWTAIAILRALSHAHSRGVFHHGLTPERVLFFDTVDGDWGFPVVTDWGVGRVIESELGGRLDPEYAAPEQLDPETFGSPDQATDVYRAGAVLYELFTGRPLYTYIGAEGGSTQDVWPAPPSEVDATLPERLDDILFRALSKEKTVRYETIEDFLGAMEGFVREYASTEVFEVLRTMERGGPAAAFDSGLSSQERTVLRVVADADKPLTVREVTTRIEEDRFYSLRYPEEAASVLDTLVDMGFLAKVESGNIYYKVREDDDDDASG